MSPPALACSRSAKIIGRASRAISTTRVARSLKKKGSELVISARTCCCLQLVKASSIWPNVLALRIRSGCLRAAAAVCAAMPSSTLGGFSGFTSTAMMPPSGISSRARSSRLVTNGEL